MTRQIIRTDGTVEVLAEPVPLRKLAELIGADTLDTVVLRHMGYPLHVMLVDDLGYEVEQLGPVMVDGVAHFERRCVRARKPVNAEATRLYHLNCQPGTTHQIVGDVVIVPDDEEEFAP
jgi:hypothetical protein